MPGLDRERLCSCRWLYKNCTWSESRVRLYRAAPGALRGRGARLEASWKRRSGSLNLATLPWGPLRLPDMEAMMRWRREALHRNGPGGCCALGQSFREAVPLKPGHLVNLVLQAEKGGAVL